MQVPIRRTPQTPVDAGQRGYARGASVDYSPLAQGAESIRDALIQEERIQQEENRKRQQFDLNKALLEEKLRAEEDFQSRMRNGEIDVYSFAEGIDTDYQATHVAMLDRFWDSGYDRDLLENAAIGLGGIRDEYFAKGLMHQATVLRSRAIDDADKLGTLASQVVAGNPDSFAQMSEEVRINIENNPDLTEPEKLELIGKATSGLRSAGAKAFATTRPDEVFRLLDPNGLYRKEKGLSSSGQVQTYSEGSWQKVAADVAATFGLKPEEVAAVFSYETGGTFDPNIVGGKNNQHLGLIQFGKWEQAHYGIKQGSSPEEWKKAITSFLNDRGFKPGMGVLDLYSTINAGSPGRYNASDGNGVVRGHVEKILSQHMGKASSWMQMGADTPIETIDPGAPSGDIAPPPPHVSTAEASYDPTSAQTGNPLLDALNGDERLQVLGWASEQVAQRTAKEGAAMDVTVQNILAEALSNGGAVQTEIPAESEILRIYGEVKGPQVWSQIQQTIRVGKSIQGFRTLSPEVIQSRLDALEPQPGSATYATDLQVYEAAEKAAAALLEERETDPAAYAQKYFPSVREAQQRSLSEYNAALDRAYKQLGIDPNTAAPYSEETMKRVVEKYGSMDPAQKRAFLIEQSSSMSEDRFQRFVKAMKGTTAETDAYIYQLMKSWPGYTPVFDRILAGREILAKDPARKPKPETVNTAFRAETARALQNLNPDASRAINAAAIALYVQAGGDTSADGFDTKLYSEQLAIAMGGSLPVNMSRGAARDHTILPPGVSETRFQSWIDRLQPGDLTKISVEKKRPMYSDGKTLAVLEDIKDEGVFVMVSPGVYIIKMGSDGRPLMTETGRPFRVKLGRGFKFGR